MDFNLTNLLKLPNITVLSCQQQEGFICLNLEFFNEGIIELTVEQVSITEELSCEQVQNIFSRKAEQKNRFLVCVLDNNQWSNKHPIEITYHIVVQLFQEKHHQEKSLLLILIIALSFLL